MLKVRAKINLHVEKLRLPSGKARKHIHIKIFQGEKRYTFVSEAKAADTFSVVRFSGHEAISRPYRFKIKLGSSQWVMKLLNKNLTKSIGLFLKIKGIPGQQ